MSYAEEERPRGPHDNPRPTVRTETVPEPEQRGRRTAASRR